MSPEVVVGQHEPAAVPRAAWIAALLALPGVGPRRLDALLADRSPAAAWAAVASAAGSVRAVLGPDGARQAARVAATWDVAAFWESHHQAGVGVASRGEDAYPEALADDTDPPALLFWRGDIAVAREPARVAIVGTRRCTRYGHDIARDLGTLLADAGVAVVSGLALGIDAAAHEGALATAGAPPLGVVATGLDVVYPPRHRQLWDAVGTRGALLTEVPLGTAPDRWRFPARNRIIAALADVVVVVESRRQGGSMHTVQEALQRGRTVMAVPGSVRSPASEGTNHLIAEGALPVCRLDDVLLALGQVLPSVGPAPGTERSRGVTPGTPAAALLEALCWEPMTVDAAVHAAGLDTVVGLAAMDELEAAGLASRRGPYAERVAPRC